MAQFDDIDIFAGPERDMMGVPVTGSSRDRQLDTLEGMARQRYIDPVENRAKDMVKMQVAEALSSVPGIKGEAISSIIALADSQNPDDKLMFNQIVSRLDLPVDVRRMGDDYAVSKRFEDVLGDNSSVGVSAFLPDEGDDQYSLSAEKRFPNFLGGEARVGGNISAGGDPEIRASFMKRFAGGGEVFGYSIGGTVGEKLLNLGRTTGKTQKERVTEDFPVKVYHGTDSAEDIDVFDPDAGTFSRRNTGTFATESPTQASTYGKTVMPLQINDADFAVADFNGNWDSASEDAALYLPDGEKIDIGFMNTDDVSRLARSKGVAGVRFDGVTDLGGRRYPDMDDAVEDYMNYGSYQYAVFDPTRIKGRFAIGDPAEKNTGQIMKSIGGLGAATGLGLLAAPKEAEAGGGGGIIDLGRAIAKGDFDPRFDPRTKEQDMLRNLEAEIVVDSNYALPKPTLSLSDLEGEDFVLSMSDRTRALGDVKSINRVRLIDPIHLPGGQDFMFSDPNAVWASAKAPSSKILQLARDLKSKSGKDPLYIPWRMAPTGGDFSTTTGELMLGYAAANMTKATKKALDKAMRSYRTKGSVVKGKRVNAGLKVDDWKGIDDPSSVEVWRNTPDPIRKELMNMMDVGFRDKGGLSIGAARLINADPTQLTAKDAGIQNVGRIFSDIDIFESDHPSYPFAVPGAGIGVLRNAGEATAFDLIPEARFGKAQKKVKDPANPTDREIRSLQNPARSGTITETILRRMEARGVDINSISGLTGGALTFTLLSAGLVTPQEAEAGGIKQFVNDIPRADSVKQAKEQGYDLDNVMYHASKQDIDEFVPGYADGLTFLTPNKEFANNWLGKGKFQERQGGTGAIEGVRAEKKRFGEEADKILESLPEDQRDQYFEEILLPRQQQLIRDEQLADSAIYPVVTKAKKPFVPHKDYKVLEELLGEEKMNEGFEVGGSFIMGMPTYGDALKSGNYLLYENPEVVEFLKSKGYDSMFLKESTDIREELESTDYSTFAVFDPTDIRSVNAKFDPKEKGSPKILATGLLATGLAAMGDSQKARADTLAAQGATHEMVLDALSGGVAPVAGGIAGLAEYTTSVPERLRGGDEAGENIAARVKAVREGVAEGLNYEPTSEMGRSMSKSAQEGLASFLQPAIEYAEPEVKRLIDYIQSEEQRNSPLGGLYRGGQYLYEDIFGEAEREGAKSAIDAAI